MSLLIHTYRLALWFLPRNFRERYREEMVRVFAEALRDEHGFGRMRFVARATIDLTGTLARQRLENLDRRVLLALAVAALLGIAIAVLDFHGNEVQPTVGALIIAAFALAIAMPRRAWSLAAGVAIWLPIVHVAAFVIHPIPTTSHNPYLSRLFLLVPAMISCLLGAGGGVLIRKVARAGADWIDRASRERRR